jgi:glycosyltransferase involved in cell wall biosynthesis
MALNNLSLLHRAWRVLPPELRRDAFTHVSAVLAPRPDLPPPAAQRGLAVGGEISRASGLGEAARLLLAGLESLGVPNWRFEAGPVAPRGAQLPPAGVPLLMVVNAPVLPAALLRLPRGALRGRRVVANWYWELPVAPPNWAPGARFVHELWVPSRFTQAALEPLMPGRVRVVSLPVAVTPPHPSALRRADFGLPDHVFLVLTSFNLASSFARKNPLAAIEAFRAAFGHATDVLLLLKVSHIENFPADMALLRGAIGDAPNIRLETRVLPASDSHALTACADAVLSLHRSEGFGLVPAEAMALGKPVIATDWSGTTDFLDDSCAIPVPYQLVPARDPRGVFEAPGAVWAQADVGAAAEALRRLHADPGLRARLGDSARRAVMTRLGTDSLAAAVRGLGLGVPS